MSATVVHSGTKKTTQNMSKKTQFIVQPSFGNTVSAEWKKIFSLRSGWVAVALFILCYAGIDALDVLLYKPGESGRDWTDVIMFMPLAQLLAIIFGTGVAVDFRDKTHAHAFMTTRYRAQWLISKMIVVYILIAVASLIGIAIGAGLYIGFLGENFDSNSSPLLFIALAVLILPLYGVMSVGFTAFIRSRVAGISIPIVWFLLGESTLYTFQDKYAILKFIYTIAPGTRLHDLNSWFTAADASAREALAATGVMAPAVSLAVIAGWTVVLVALGIVANQRRDVK